MPLKVGFFFSLHEEGQPNVETWTRGSIFLRNILLSHNMNRLRVYRLALYSRKLCYTSCCKFKYCELCTVFQWAIRSSLRIPRHALPHLGVLGMWRTMSSTYIFLCLPLEIGVALICCHIQSSHLDLAHSNTSLDCVVCLLGLRPRSVWGWGGGGEGPHIQQKKEKG
jgi:hypothetical protein